MGIQVGDIYNLPDATVRWEPPPKQPKDSRYVVVVSNAEELADPDWRVCLIVPVSSVAERKTKYCVEFSGPTSPFGKQSWARVTHVQAMAKNTLETSGKYRSTIPIEKLQTIRTNIVRYLGLLDEGDNV